MIIGETGVFHPTNEIEVISLKNDTISQSGIRMPALPMPLKKLLLATKLPNGDIFLSGKPDSLLIYNSQKREDYGWCGTNYYNRPFPSDNDTYFVLKKGNYECKLMEQMYQEVHDHASVFVGGRIYSCGGTETFWRHQTGDWDWHKATEDVRLKSEHLAFNLGGEILGTTDLAYACGPRPQWTSLKEMPVAVKGHASSRLNENQIMITGGENKDVSKKLSMNI